MAIMMAAITNILFSIRAITKRVRRMVDEQYACWRETLLPALEKNGIRILDIAQLDLPDLAWLVQYYRTQVRPVLTPLAIDATGVLLPACRRSIFTVPYRLWL